MELLGVLMAKSIIMAVPKDEKEPEKYKASTTQCLFSLISLYTGFEQASSMFKIREWNGNLDFGCHYYDND